MTITAPVSDSTLSFLKSTKQLLIGGQWVESINGATFPTVDPATEEEICEVAHGTADDVDLAVEAARSAFEGGAWPAMTASERGKTLWRLADLMGPTAGLVELPVISATSGVPSLSANASACGPIMNSCSTVPMFLIWKVTVSPFATVTSIGVNINASSTVISTTRGLALVPGVKPKPEVACGVAVGATDDVEPEPALHAVSTNVLRIMAAITP